MVKQKNTGLSFLLFVGPAILVLGIIAIMPTLYALYSGFWNWNLHRPARRVFTGFENYINLFKDSRFLESFSLTFFFTFLTVGGTMVLGFLLALLVWKPFRGKNTTLALLTVPMIMTPVVSALIWKVFLFEANVGLVNWFFGLLGIKGPAWIASSPWAFVSIVLVNIWFMTPFVLLILEAALSGIPKEPLEAAAIDGAGYWKRVRYIILPMLKGTILFVLIFRITIDYRTFDIVYTMTGGGPAFDTQVLSIWVYNIALRTFEIGYANAGAALMMIAIALVCSAILAAAARERGNRWISK